MKTFIRLLAFLSPFRWLIALAILLGSVMIASNIGLLGMAAYLIAASALGPLLVLLSIPMYFVRATSVVRALSRYAERLISHNATFHLLARLRVWTYSRIEPQAPAHLLTHRSGDMLARLVADIEELQNFYLQAVSPIVIALVISLFTFGIFSIFSMGLAWVALAFLVIAGSGVPLLAALLSRGLGKQQVRARAELNTQVVDGLQGMQDVLAFGRSHTQLESVAACDRSLGRVQRYMAMITGLQTALNDLLMNTAMWALIILAIPLVTTRYIDGVYLGVIGLLILASFEAVQPLAPAFQRLGHALAAAERVFAVADALPPVIESATPQPVPADPDGYYLTFEHVHFSYCPGEREVLSDISFDLHQGIRVAIVGPSGAGKSTLARLALRFWDPVSGVIRLNGQNIHRYSLRDLRDLIGVVAQDTYIFNDTLRANLLLARSGASEAEIEAAVEQAQLSEFVRQLPLGLKTWVGEQGLQLSGGERQRLAIARTLLKNAPILILDEVTANLDPLTERALLDTLDELSRGRITLHITHRLLAMERMDEILVLDHGRIVERGTHDGLLAMEGLYRQLFDVQRGVLNFS
jgi:ATP-binding cassette, subfamily C, bacterial CydC